MNKNKIISTFSSYAQTFDLNNQLVAQKLQHSMNVANYSLEIANFLLLDDSLKTCAFLIGLLHEYGSFEAITKKAPQIRNRLTMDYLFKENKIESYTQNKTQITLIKKTLQAFHFSKDKQKTLNLPSDNSLKNTQSSKVLTLLSILKDADTLELFGMFKRKIIAPFLEVPFIKKSFSKTVLTAFRARQKIHISDVASNLDKVLLFVSLFFDLNHLISKNIAMKIDFEQGIVACYNPHLSEPEQQKLERVINTFRNTFYPKND